MKLYGIFDQNKNYKLLRYSEVEQINRTYQHLDYNTKTYYEVNEICLPEIEYFSENIGKTYDINTNTFNN